jgi:hypothetical protein
MKDEGERERGEGFFLHPLSLIPSPLNRKEQER